MSYGSALFWDGWHKRDQDQGWSAARAYRWMLCFLPYLEASGVRRIYDLGCGRGLDALELGRRGYEVEASDYCTAALDFGRSEARRENLPVHFLRADAAAPLTYPDNHFDAVMSNMVLHMFSPEVAVRIVEEIRRVLVPDGLFVFHVNSERDREHRLRRQGPVREISPGYYELRGGQTMRFFSDEDVQELLSGWHIDLLEHVESRAADGKLVKQALRVVARRR